MENIRNIDFSLIKQIGDIISTSVGYTGFKVMDAYPDGWMDKDIEYVSVKFEGASFGDKELSSTTKDFVRNFSITIGTDKNGRLQDFVDYLFENMRKFTIYDFTIDFQNPMFLTKAFIRINNINYNDSVFYNNKNFYEAAMNVDIIYYDDV